MYVQLTQLHGPLPSYVVSVITTAPVSRAVSAAMCGRGAYGRWYWSWRAADFYGPMPAPPRRDARYLHAPRAQRKPSCKPSLSDRDAGVSGLNLTEVPPPARAAGSDVFVKVHAAGFTPGELDWPST